MPRESIIKCTIIHIHADIYIYIYTYIMHNVITQGKERQTLPMFQGYGPARYKNCTKNIFVPREHGPSKKAGKVKGTKRGGTLIHALERRLRERKGKRKPLREA